LALFPSLDPARVVTVYNGFDEEVLGRGGPSPPDGETRRIAYVGTFYYDPLSRANLLTPGWRRAPHRWVFYTPRREDWLYRSPWFFLRGLRRYIEKRPDLATRLRVDFVGAIPTWLPGMLRETGTEALVTLHGPVTHAQAIRLQKEADAVLLTSAKVLGGRDYSIAGKLFEYIGLRRPILAVLTDGAMRDIVAQTGLGLMADPDDEDAVAGAIERVVVGPSVSPDEAVIARFERGQTVREMAECLRRAAAEGYRA
jgi:glycosyltransferase involved in cell wall biosynthesis